MRRMLVDTICTNPACERQRTDVWVEDGQYPSCELCEYSTVRMWAMGSSANVNGDECYVLIKNGLCHPNGAPKLYTSKAAIRRDEKITGWKQHVTHVPSPGSDKNKHTQRFV